jgi:hypothetical protein
LSSVIKSDVEGVEKGEGRKDEGEENATGRPGERMRMVGGDCWRVS